MNVTETIIDKEILYLVKSAKGISHSELKSELYLQGLDDNYEQVLEKLIKANQLIEIEYSIDMSKVDSFYLPAGTRINIRGNKEVAHRI